MYTIIPSVYHLYKTDGAITYSKKRILEGVQVWKPFNGQITTAIGTSGYVRIRVTANGNIQDEFIVAYGIYSGIARISPAYTFIGEGNHSLSLDENNYIVVNVEPNYGVRFEYNQVW